MGRLYEITSLKYSITGNDILRDISFDVDEQEYISIIGTNGAGKTTLLRHLNRIVTPTGGHILLKKAELGSYTQKKIASIVSYVPQSPTHIQHYTVKEFIMMGRYPYLGPFASPASDDDTAVKESMEVTNTACFANRDMVSLSGGELQKVYIAAGLAQGGEVMLLDEPATFLDPAHQHEIFSILRNVNRSGTAIISVTHNINTAVLTGRRIIGMRDGEIIYDGDADGIMNNSVLSKIYKREFRFTDHPDTGNRIAIPEVYL